MKIIYPRYQYEIRTTINLDFERDFREIFNSYMPEVQNLRSNDETGFNKRYSLFFEDNFTITFGSNMLVFFYEGDVESLQENNSLVQDLFFDVYSRLCKSDSYGDFLNHIIYANAILLTDSEKNDQDLFDKIMKKSFDQNLSVLMEQPNNFAVTFENKTEPKNQEYLSFGPYIGPEDLKIRNLGFKREDFSKLAERKGIFTDHKIVTDKFKPNFKNYNKLAEQMTLKNKKIWKLLME